MSPGTRRLMKEAAELLTTPSPHFTASPVSDTNLYDWHFTLAGPPAPSPYANGIYHGRIVFPPTYPLRPPSFRFLTPSGRFEVNREICLSISGHHEETWQPAWGIRTALLAIRSFMDGDAKGQVGGLDVADEVRREYAGRSRGWRCEVCGRGNEEILAEVCAAVGEGEGDGENENDGKDQKNRGVGGGVGVVEEVKTETTTTRTGEGVSREGVEVVAPPSVPEKREDVQEQQAVPVQSPASTTTATPSSPSTLQQRTRTQPQPQVHSQQVQIPPAQSAQSTDSPWLDRAIIGVLVALVLMILRRVARSEDY